MRRQLVDQVITILKERISSGEFEIGSRFPSESELMEQLGVGKTTIREAVRALGHSGLLSIRQGSGTYVQAIAAEEPPLAKRLQDAQVLDVFAVRQALDLEMVRLAARARSDEDLTTMRAILRIMHEAQEDSGDPQKFSQASVDLHLAVAGATGNSVLVDLYTSFTAALQGAMCEVAAMPGVMEACISRHERLVDALAAQEPDTAEAITRQYLERTTALLRQILASAEEGELATTAATS